MSKLRICGQGALIWLVPFLVAIPFMGQDGQPRVDLFLFKTIMLLTGSAVGAWMLVKTLPLLPAPISRQSLRVGLVWLAISWALDIAVLLPLSGMPFADWVTQIGLRYLTIPIACAAAGLAIDRARLQE